MRITITYNHPQRQLYGDKQDIISEKAVLEEVHDVKKALIKLQHTATLLPLHNEIHSFIQELSTQQPDCIFNLCESVYGLSIYEMNIPALYEILKIPYTGSSALSIGLCLDKVKTKYLLQGAGLPTPNFTTTINPNKLSQIPPYPLIVKPSREDGSRGISPSSIVYDKPSLQERAKYIIEEYHQPPLVEQYIEGRELNISLIGNDIPQIIGISEVDFHPYRKYRILTYRSKWEETSREYLTSPVISPPEVSRPLKKKILSISKQAYRVLGCQGYARIDFRVDKYNTPYIIDVNPNPDIAQKAGFARAAEKSGMPYTALIQKIVDLSIQNSSKNYNNHIRIRKMVKKDTKKITQILNKVKVFRKDEIRIAKEIIKTSLQQYTKRDYLLYVADYNTETVGYLCFGKTPLTEGTYDIYWLVVDPPFQNQGIGARLLEFAENYIRNHRGRKIIIETSSKKEYEPTRSFYRDLGYREVARIHNFYLPNDDKYIYEKDLI